MVPPKIQQIKEKAKVTSPKGKRDWKDQIIGWITAVFAFIGYLISSAAESLVPFLKTILGPDQPLWKGVLISFVIGVIAIIVRQYSGPKEDETNSNAEGE